MSGLAAELFANNFQSNLAANCAVADTTITMGGPAPAALQGGQFRLLVDQELMLVTGGQTGATWNVTRGIEGTAAAAHFSGVLVIHLLTAAAVLALCTGAAAGSIEGLPVRAYSGSLYFVGVQRGSAICSANAFDRLLGRLRNPFTIGEPLYGNFACSGMTASDIAAYAMGTPTIASAKNYPSVSAGTWTPTVLPTGIVILNGIANGALNDSTAMRSGTQNALDALIRYFRSQSVLQDTNAAFAYTGTWTGTANQWFPGGNHHHTTTQNDKVTVTTPSGTDFDLLLVGFDTASFSGSAFSVTVDGNPFTWAWNPGTTFGQASATGSVWGSNAPITPIAIPLRGLSNQAHTVVVTKTGVTGGLLNVCQLLTPSPTPPTLIVQKMYYMPSAISSALVDTYNGFIDTIVSRFPNDNSVVVFDPNALGFNPSTMISSLDSSHEHPNDAGMQFLADQLTSLIYTLPPREGLQVPL